MFNDLAAYFYENVVSSFLEYREIKASGTAGGSRDIRSALVAASALFHIREHLPPGNALSRTAIERLCSDYGVLGDIVNASKHSAISGRTPHGAPLVTHAAQLSEEITITEYEDQDGSYRFVEKLVVAQLTDGSRRSVLEVLTNVMNFWQVHLNALGVVAKPRTYPFDSSQQPKSRAECESNRMGLVITPGLRFRSSMRLQRYNYETGVVEPVDLTGCQAEFRIYRPRYEVDVSLTHNASGTAFKKTVTLSEEESLVFAGMKTDDERKAYVNSLPCAQAAMRALASEVGLSATPQSAESNGEGGIK